MEYASVHVRFLIQCTAVYCDLVHWGGERSTCQRAFIRGTLKKTVRVTAVLVLGNSTKCLCLFKSMKLEVQ
jgi:hypothetical protein